MKPKFRTKALHYELISDLGEGLNGHVFKARRTDAYHHVGQIVAVKILKSKNSVDKWKREFESLSRVESPHCVRVLGFEWMNDLPALILEHIEGLTLRELLTNGPLDPAIAREILAQMQLGLDDLWRKGLCHGDLSLNNVMVSKTGQVKLLDFGMANANDGSLQATPQFLAPELFTHPSPNPATDLYSLGVIEAILLNHPSPRMSVKPRNRQRWSSVPIAKVQKQLGETVTRLMVQQTLRRSQKTAVMNSSAPADRRSPTMGHILRTAALWAFLVFCSPPSSGRTAPSIALLKVRSLHWMKLRINGRDAGFAPMDRVISRPETIRIDWKTQNHSGVKILHLHKNQVLILDDHDFMPPG